MTEFRRKLYRAIGVGGVDIWKSRKTELELLKGKAESAKRLLDLVGVPFLFKEINNVVLNNNGVVILNPPTHLLRYHRPTQQDGYIQYEGEGYTQYSLHWYSFLSDYEYFHNSFEFQAGLHDHPLIFGSVNSELYFKTVEKLMNTQEEVDNYTGIVKREYLFKEQKGESESTMIISAGNISLHDIGRIGLLREETEDSIAASIATSSVFSYLRGFHIN